MIKTTLSSVAKAYILIFIFDKKPRCKGLHSSALAQLVDEQLSQAHLAQNTYNIEKIVVLEEAYRKVNLVKVSDCISLYVSAEC